MRSAPPQPACRWIILVARGQDDLYEHLVRALQHDKQVKVVMDRRKDVKRNPPGVAESLRTRGSCCDSNGALKGHRAAEATARVCFPCAGARGRPPPVGAAEVPGPVLLRHPESFVAKSKEPTTEKFTLSASSVCRAARSSARLELTFLALGLTLSSILHGSVAA
jgi:hypothetical protein